MGWRIKPQCVLKGNKVKLVHSRSASASEFPPKKMKFPPEAHQAVVKWNLLQQEEPTEQPECSSGLKGVLFVTGF